MTPTRVAARLAALSLMGLLALALAEVALRITGAGEIPAELARSAVEVDGATHAYRWQGKVHVENRWGFRWIPPLPRKGDRPRILAVGDSLTYGLGVAADETWPAVLEATTGYEVVNFGRCAASSQDVLENVRSAFGPVEHAHLNLPPELASLSARPSVKRWRYEALRPDRIVYAVCLNDLLPSGLGEPEPPDNACTRRWRVCKLVSQGLFRATSPDFEQDIHRRGSLERFSHDVREMNQVAIDNGLPPVLAMVVTQSPGRLLDLIGEVEAVMTAANMEVIPAATYTHGHEGELWTVSRWEGHPNADAHRRFAEQLARALKPIQSCCAPVQEGR